MQADPNRQWFVYDQEREQGPFSELELRQKINSQQLSDRAYVYTEGMADWATVEDTPVLSEAEKQEAPKEVQKDAREEASKSAEPRDEANASDSGDEVEKEPHQETPTGREETRLDLETESSDTGDSEPSAKEADEEVEESAAEKVAASRPKKALALGTLALLFVAIIVTSLVGIAFLKPSLFQDLRNQLPFLKLGPATEQTQEDPVSEEPALDAQPANTKAANLDWDLLKQFRQSRDSQGPAFMLASKNYSRDFPVLSGAISPLIEGDLISLAVFPDTERSLMAVPVLWRWDLPIIEGFFVAGPLVLPGDAPLPPGRWIAMASVNGTFLGEVRFESGVWPGQNELLRYREQIKGETISLAQREFESLSARLNELKAAHGELQEKSRLALRRGATRKAWQQFETAWTDKINVALDDQDNLLRGPMFFATLQSSLFDALKALAVVKNDLELFSRGGAALLRKESAKNTKQIWGDFDARLKSLEERISAVNVEEDAVPLTIDKEVVRLQLTETQ